MPLVAKEPLEDAAAGPPLDEGEGTQRKVWSAVICVTRVYTESLLICFQGGQEMRHASRSLGDAGPSRVRLAPGPASGLA